MCTWGTTRIYTYIRRWFGCTSVRFPSVLNRELWFFSPFPLHLHSSVSSVQWNSYRVPINNWSTVRITHVKHSTRLNVYYIRHTRGTSCTYAQGKGRTGRHFSTKIDSLNIDEENIRNPLLHVVQYLPTIVFVVTEKLKTGHFLTVCISRIRLIYITPYNMIFK